MNEFEWISTTEAAQLIGCTTNTVGNYRARGLLLWRKVGGGLWRGRYLYSRESIKNLLQQQGKSNEGNGTAASGNQSA